MATVNRPTDPKLYARIKSLTKKKFKVYPSAYANAYLVKTYKKKGGGYRKVMKWEKIFSVKRIRKIKKVFQI